MKNILDLTWKEIELLDKDKTFLFMTVAPLEEHGTHLPIGVDIELGEYWKNKTIKKLEQKYPNNNFISMPFLPIAAGSMKTFPGCIYIKPKELRKILTSILKNIKSWEIKNLIILASHGDPFHNMAIEKACEYINKKYGTNYISPMGAFFSNQELNIDLKLGTDVDIMLKKYPNDFHAGWIETSMMMDISPEKVSPNYLNITNIEVTEKEMMFPKKYLNKTIKKGHLGYPQYSKLELGIELNDSTSNFLVKTIEKMINNCDLNKYRHHFLYQNPFLRFIV